MENTIKKLFSKSSDKNNNRNNLSEPTKDKNNEINKNNNIKKNFIDSMYVKSKKNILLI